MKNSEVFTTAIQDMNEEGIDTSVFEGIDFQF